MYAGMAKWLRRCSNQTSVTRRIVQAETPPTVETLLASKHLLAEETAIAEWMLATSSAVFGRGLASYSQVNDRCVDGNFETFQPEDETWRRTSLM
jgi:hypothetical protein